MEWCNGVFMRGWDRRKRVSQCGVCGEGSKSGKSGNTRIFEASQIVA